MARIEAKLAEMGLVLPQPLQMPANVRMSLPFAWVRVSGKRAFISGHVPLCADAQLRDPLGKSAPKSRQTKVILLRAALLLHSWRVSSERWATWIALQHGCAFWQ